jgi:hypothetical protein
VIILMAERASALSGVTTKLAAKSDKREWHALRSKYHCLFAPDHRPRVEAWYNRYATASQKTMMQSLLRGISGVHNARVVESSEQPSQHMDRHMVRLYGGMFASDVKPSVERWLRGADEFAKDEFREVCSAINASDRISRTSYEDVFVGRQPTDKATRCNHVLKVNWESEKTVDTLRQRNRATLDLKQRGIAAAKLNTSRDSVDEEDPWDALDGIAKEHAPQFESLTHAFQIDPKSGATVFRSGAGKQQRECVRSGLPFKQAPDNTAGWLPTSRLTFKAMRPKDILYSLETCQQPQAAIVRVTASNGVVIPRVMK